MMSQLLVLAQLLPILELTLDHCSYAYFPVLLVESQTELFSWNCIFSIGYLASNQIFYTCRSQTSQTYLLQTVVFLQMLLQEDVVMIKLLLMDWSGTRMPPRGLKMKITRHHFLQTK